jgi:malate permease and related proteins
LQNIFLFSYGIFSLQSIKVGKLKAALGYFRMPVLYAMLAGVFLNVYNVPIPSFIWVPANYIADAMIALALFTLGAQVAKIKFSTGLKTVYYSLALRLAIGPLIALAIIYIFKVDGIVAQALLIGSAMPTSVNSAVIAEEYNNHPDLAAQIVLFSTLFSAITVTLVIYLARFLF